MPWALSPSRGEGVHGDDDADRGQQTTTGQGDQEQRQDDGATAQQVGRVDRATDDDGGVDGGLEADADTRQDDGGRAGEGGPGDVLDRTVLGAGEVTGQPEDDAGEDDAQEHREHGGDPRVAVQGGDLPAHAQLGVAGGQVDEGRDGAQQPGHGGRDVEATVDRLQAGLAGPRAGDHDAQDSGDGADGGNDEREDQTVLAEGGLSEDERGHQGHRVGLEEVSGHTGAVAHVVAHVVGDGGGVAGVVLGIPVRPCRQDHAHVGGLGEDATADPHEHGQEGGTEAEALQDGGSVATVDDHHDGGAQQAETHRRHADHTTGAEGDLHPAVTTAGPTGRGRHPDVGPDGEGHAEVADGSREAGADDEEDAAPEPDAAVPGKQEEQAEHEDDEQTKSPELAAQVRLGALLDRTGDGPHVLGALVRGQHLGAEEPCHHEPDGRDRRHHDDEVQVPSGQVHLLAQLGGKCGP